MESQFTSEFFAGNRQRLRELFTGKAPIVITANGLLQKGADVAFQFAQDANFWYLTGIDVPDIILVMDRDKEYLVVPDRDANRVAFDGAIEYEALVNRSGVKTVLSAAEGWKELLRRVDRVKHVATIAAPPAYVEGYDMYTNPARATLIQRLRDHKPELELLDVTPHLTRLRIIKQPVELASIQASIDITVRTLKEILRPTKLKQYTFEYEIEAELSRGFRRRGAHHGFDPIIAGGARACVIHPYANAALAADELIVLDVGAEVEHYSADITRTVAVRPPSRRQQQVYDAVLAVQVYAMSLLKPGVNLRDYEMEIEHFMGEKLRELGLIKTIKHDAVRQYFPHATSHYLGLNVHDVGDRGKTGILEAGAVLTVEPGIYIPKESIGIRIEDDILITKNGNKVLSAKLPRVLA